MLPAPRRWPRAGLAPLVLGAEGRAGAAERHPGLTALALAGAVRRRRTCCARRWSPARCRSMRRGQRHARSMRASTRCAASPARSASPRRCGALLAGSAHPRQPPRRRPAGAGPLFAALPAAGDGRLPRPAARMPRGVLEREANAVTDNPLVFAETARSCRAAISTPSRWPSPPTRMALALAETRRASRAPHRPADRPGAVRAAGLPGARRRAQLRLHDRPGDRGGAGRGEQSRWPRRAASTACRPRANQEDHVSMATGAARRLGDMADNTAGILAIELLAAAQGLDFHRAAAERRRRCEAAHALVRGRGGRLGRRTASWRPTSPRCRRWWSAAASPRWWTCLMFDRVWLNAQPRHHAGRRPRRDPRMARSPREDGRIAWVGPRAALPGAGARRRWTAAAPGSCPA